MHMAGCHDEDDYQGSRQGSSRSQRSRDSQGRFMSDKDYDRDSRHEPAYRFGVDNYQRYVRRIVRVRVDAKFFFHR